MTPRKAYLILRVALVATAAGGACLALTGNLALALLQAAGWGCVVALASRQLGQGASSLTPSKPDNTRLVA